MHGMPEQILGSIAIRSKRSSRLITMDGPYSKSRRRPRSRSAGSSQRAQQHFVGRIADRRRSQRTELRIALDEPVEGAPTESEPIGGRGDKLITRVPSSGQIDRQTNRVRVSLPRSRYSTRVVLIRSNRHALVLGHLLERPGRLRGGLIAQFRTLGQHHHDNVLKFVGYRELEFLGWNRVGLADLGDGFD
jgi:hypothetical protein